MTYLNCVDYSNYYKVFTDVAQKFGTPTFAFDTKLFVERIDHFKSLTTQYFDDNGINCSISYASKAFLSLKVAQIVKNCGLNIDTCSLIESKIAFNSTADGSKIGLHGNNKSDAEIKYAVENNFHAIFLDNFEEIGRVDKIAKDLGKTANVYLRVTTGVHAGVHEYIATATEDQKFGISLANGKAFNCVQEILKCLNLKFKGVHSHIGSQIAATAGFLEALEKLLQFRKEVSTELGHTIAELDLGGGFGVQYTPADPELDLEELFEGLSNKIIAQSAADGLELPSVSFEPGRYLIAPCMSTIYTVGAIKDVEYEDGKFRRYISVDGGMSDNIRPALYQAKYTCFTLSGELSDGRENPQPQLQGSLESTVDEVFGRNQFSGRKAGPCRVSKKTVNLGPEIAISSQNSTLSRIVGKHCESGDILVDEIYLPAKIQRGDLLVIPITGAYSYSMASNYNMLLKPAVVGFEGAQATDSEIHEIIPRQNESELIK
ncbi:diaminopimelate decarboxylase [Actinomycetota bacterium]|nr:diaminopimelate decarboxylase [Actinomycetota bacterium]